ncbi:bifunctional adenosylcobinamide kinase/adenosylcobinamide-phosphate guanylyltransferase [bacterium]|nr:MAG: bifunctional adenosylcobinamide kinase/adenosylcobinamide-phosphate guanylyltransferase [bacterium]
MGKITFILGGARSGKSQYALSLARESGAGKVLFIATASAGDREMRLRIARHKRSRPRGWRTIEEPRSLIRALKRAPRNTQLVIVDCLTLLITNLMLEGHSDSFIEKEVKSGFKLLKEIGCDSIVVSNEVGLGIVPENNLARRFRDTAGRINQAAARMSNEAYLMFAGLSIKMKGEK